MVKPSGPQHIRQSRSRCAYTHHHLLLVSVCPLAPLLHSLLCAHTRALSCQEHPLLQVPCWQIHPCRTRELMAIIRTPTAADQGQAPEHDRDGTRQHTYVEGFISTIGRLVGMPQPHSP